MLKAAFTVGATLCFVQLVCSSPALRLKREDDDSSEEESAFEKTLGDLFSVIIMASLMTCETFASARSTHCSPLVLPKNREVDRQNHVVSSALMELWEDLRTIEPVQDMYAEMLKKFTISKNDDALNLWFEGIDKAMAADPRLAQRYNELKSKYETLVTLESDHLEKEKLRSSADRETKFENDKRIKELRVNLIFASRLNNNADETDKKYHKKLKFQTLAKTMVEMSKSADKYEKLQQMYRESLAEVATNVALLDSESKDIASALYRKLKQKINANSAVSSEFKEKAKDMLKKLKNKE